MKWILILITFFVFTEVYSQKAIKRSSVGSSGSSSKVNVNGKMVLIQQSVGQASIIGTSKKNGCTLIQGFQQPLLSVLNTPKAEENKLYGALYPNPFENSLEIKFDEEVEGVFLISIYDTNGKLSYSKIQNAEQKIQLNLSSLKSGEYFLKINCKNKTLISKIIKN